MTWLDTKMACTVKLLVEWNHDACIF